MTWLLVGLAVLGAGIGVVAWAACALSARLSRDEIMGHYLDDY